QRVEREQDAGHLPAWPGKARRQPGADWVDQGRADDWDRWRGPIDGEGAGGGGGQHDLWLELDQLVRERRQPGIIAVGVAVHDLKVATFDIAELLHALRKDAHPGRRGRR